jgi:serine/threonine-protein kinase
LSRLCITSLRILLGIVPALRRPRPFVLALDVSAPRVIDRKYELIELLGLGSMGEVWIARHLGLGQTCAVKLIGRETHEAPDAAGLRFTREARIAAALSRMTRHIVSVTDFGRDEGGAYLVMELLGGESLDARVAEGCTPNEVSVIVSQIAKGLGVAHREGILHRDLKPANVFLTRGEDDEVVVKLLDFGIARILAPLAPITAKDVVVGSPAYMSPEQVLGETLDARADVWSLAVVAFEALTGVLPFAADTTDATLRRITMFDATPIHSVHREATPALEAFFARAFATSIEERFQTAEELARTFAAAIAPPPFAPPKRDRRRLAMIAALCSLAIGASALLFARSSSSDVAAPVAEVRAPQANVTIANEVMPVEAPSAAPSIPPRETPRAPARTTPPPPKKPNVDPSSIF